LAFDINGGSGLGGGLGMKVARMCGGIIMIAGPDPEEDIWPLGVMALPFGKEPPGCGIF